MEAMSMELPVVSTYCSGIPELVEDGWNGILVRQRDPLQLAEAIRYLLENPSVAREYGKRGPGKNKRTRHKKEYPKNSSIYSKKLVLSENSNHNLIYRSSKK
jgi:glycosyltransferase involved in cell wall biosynthesis